MLSPDGEIVGSVDELVEYVWPSVCGKGTNPPDLFSEVLATMLMEGWKDLLGVPILETVKVAHQALSENLPLALEESRREALELVWLHRIPSLAFQQSGRVVDEGVFHAWGIDGLHDELSARKPFVVNRALNFAQLPRESLPSMMARLAADPISCAVLKASALASIATSEFKRNKVDLEGWVQGSDLRSRSSYDTWEEIALTQTLFDSEGDGDLVATVVAGGVEGKKRWVSLHPDVFSEDLLSEGFIDSANLPKPERPYGKTPDPFGADWKGPFTPGSHTKPKDGDGVRGLSKSPSPEHAALIVAKIYERFLNHFGFQWGELDPDGARRDSLFAQARSSEDFAQSIDPTAASHFVNHYLRLSRVEEDQFAECLANALALWSRRLIGWPDRRHDIGSCPTVIWMLISPFTYADGLVLGNPLDGLMKTSGDGEFWFMPDTGFKKGWHAKRLEYRAGVGVVGVVSTAWAHMGKHENTIRLLFKDREGNSMSISMVQIADQLVTTGLAGNNLFFSHQRAAHGQEYAGFRAEQQMYWSHTFAGNPSFRALEKWIDSTKAWTLESVKASWWISPVFLFPYRESRDYSEPEVRQGEVWATVTIPQGADALMGEGITVAGQRTSPMIYRFRDKDGIPTLRQVEGGELFNVIESLAQRSGRNLDLHSVVTADGARLFRSGSAPVIEHPLLGQTWEPVFLGLDRLVSRLAPRFFFTLTVWPHGPGIGDDRNAYCQFMKEEDGSLLVEVGPTSMLARINPDYESLMALSGWRAPEDSGLPNFYRVFEEPFDSGDIVVTALEALVSMFLVSTADAFAVSGFGENLFNSDGLLDEVIEVHGVHPGILYGLRGFHSFPSVFNLERDLPEMSPEALWKKVAASVEALVESDRKPNPQKIGDADDHDYINAPVPKSPSDFPSDGDTLWVVLSHPRDSRAVLEFGALVKPKRYSKAPVSFVFKNRWIPAKFLGYAVMADNPPKILSVSPGAALNLIGQLRDSGRPASVEELQLPLMSSNEHSGPTADQERITIGPLSALGPEEWWKKILENKGSFSHSCDRPKEFSPVQPEAPLKNTPPAEGRNPPGDVSPDEQGKKSIDTHLMNRALVYIYRGASMEEFLANVEIPQEMRDDFETFWYSVAYEVERSASDKKIQWDVLPDW